MRALGFGTALLLVACNAGPQLTIAQNQTPLASCALSSTPTEPILEGTFDLAIGDRSSYILTPLVENHLGSDVVLDTARVRLTWIVDGTEQAIAIRCDGGEVCAEWELPCGTTGVCAVPPRGTASFEVEILPRVLTAYLREQMDAAVAAGRVPPEFDVTSTVTLEGLARDGTPVESEPFAMPVRICLGCLVTFPPDSDSPSIAGPDCCGGVTPVPACLLGQDQPIDCRHCVRTLPEICNFGRLSCAF